MVVSGAQAAAAPPQARPESVRPPAPADGSWEAFRAQRNFGSLDAVRAVSILAVIWHHAHGGFADLPITLRGFLGVDMFFVLSGFLIVTLLLRERDKAGSISLGKFYARRTLRIFPLYYAVILGVLAIVLVKPGSSVAGPFLDELPYLATYTSNWVHSASILAIAWSLATEEQFYLLWPPLERFAQRAVPLLLVLALAANQAVNFGLADPLLERVIGPQHGTLEILNSTFTPILLGVALAHVMHGAHGFGIVRRVAGFRGASLVALGALLAAASWPVQDISGLPRLSVHLAMTWWLASVAVREGHALAGPMRWAPIVRIGVVSYGMYLLHMFALHGARAAESRVMGDAPGLRFALCAALTWFAAEVSFRLFESPILRLKRRFEAAR